MHPLYAVGVLLLRGEFEEEEEDDAALFASELDAACEERGWRLVNTATATSTLAMALPPTAT